jgi:predicted nucleic acid-binding protein
MICAIDSSALLSIFKGEPEGAHWLDLCIAQAAIGELVICDVAAAEVATLFDTAANLQDKLKKLHIRLDPIRLESCCLAGHIFRQYRLKGGKREHLIPDFLISAHAFNQADCLLAQDRGYYRSYFPRLRVLN